MNRQKLFNHLIIINDVFDLDQIDCMLIGAANTVYPGYMDSLSTFKNWYEHPHQSLDLNQQHLLLSAEMVSFAYDETFTELVRGLIGTHLEPSHATWHPTKPFDIDQGHNFASGLIKSPYEQALICDQLIQACLTKYGYNNEPPVEKVYDYWQTNHSNPLNWLLDVARQIVVDGAVTHQI